MNTFGEHFTFTSFGESHGRAIGGVLDGVPAGVRIDLDLIRQQLDRRAGRIGNKAKGDRAPQNATSIFGDPAEARGEEAMRREARGRHDACVAVRAVPVVEAMAALVLADTFGTNFGEKLQE